MALTRITRGMIENGAVIVPGNLYTPNSTATTSTFLAGNGTWRVVDSLNTTTAFTIRDLLITNHLAAQNLNVINNTGLTGNLTVTGTTHLSGLLTLGTPLNQLTVTNHLSAGSLSVGSIGGGGLSISSTATFNGATTFNSATTFTTPAAFTSITANTLTSTSVVATNVTATTLTANTIRLADGTSFTSTNAIQVTWDNITRKDDANGPNRVTIGTNAGRNPDPTDPNEPSVVAIGPLAGRRLQRVGAIAIGEQAGFEEQNALSVAIGLNAGRYKQGRDPGSDARGTGDAVAIGASAGSRFQERWAVALGREAGYESQKEKSVAVGWQAGYQFQGTASIAIGALAGKWGQADNSIILNATGTPVWGGYANSFRVAPIGSDNSTTTNILCYNASTFEVVQATRQSVLGNIDYGAI
jgi:hypothetical protein